MEIVLNNTNFSSNTLDIYTNGVKSWYGHTVVLLRNTMQDFRIALGAFVIVNIAFVQVAYTLAKKVHSLFPLSEELQQNHKLLKDLAVLGTYLLSFSLLNFGFLKFTHSPLHPFAVTLISGSIFILGTYRKIE